MTKLLASYAAIVISALIVPAQTQMLPVVEVASIKEMSKRDFRYAGLSGCPLIFPRISGNRVSISGVTVCTLVRTAYSLEEFEIAGAPDWTTKDGNLLAYDIQALAEGSEILSQERARQLLQVLLAQRYQLKFHKEMRVLEVLALVVDKDGAKLTAALPPECREEAGARFVSKPSPDGKFGERVGSFLTCRAAPLTVLARSLTTYLQDPVVDRTGLDGKFNWAFSWTDRSVLASELKQRLGLRLVSRKEPIEVTVIERIEKATAN